MKTKILTLTRNNESYQEKINLFLFSSGKLISLFGSAIYSFGFGLYLLDRTGSGLTFATNMVLYTLPVVFFNPIAGVIADKFNKKTVVVGADLLNGFFLLGIYLLSNRIGLSVYLVYLSTFIMTVLTVFFNIAIESAKPKLVSKKNLVKINSWAQIISSGSYVVGPMVGGLIYAFVDIKLFLLINAYSFILAAILEFFINYQYNITNNTQKIGEKGQDTDGQLKKNMWTNMKEGYQYIFSRQHLRALIYIFISLNFFFNFSIIVPIPYLLNTIWKVDSSIYGIVQGGLPVGMIIGALLVKRVMERVSYSKLLRRINYSTAIGVLAFALPLLVFSGVPDQIFILVYYTILMVLVGLIVSWVDVPVNVLLQQIIPGKILGRVISVKLSIIKIIVPISLLFSGFLINFISPLFLFIIGSLLFALFNLWFFASNSGKKFVSISNENMGSLDTKTG